MEFGPIAINLWKNILPEKKQKFIAGFIALGHRFQAYEMKGMLVLQVIEIKTGLCLEVCRDHHMYLRSNVYEIELMPKNTLITLGSLLCVALNA